MEQPQATKAAERIVVPCAGEAKVYQVVKGKIPPTMRTALPAPNVW